MRRRQTMVVVLVVEVVLVCVQCMVTINIEYHSSAGTNERAQTDTIRYMDYVRTRMHGFSVCSENRSPI